MGIWETGLKHDGSNRIPMQKSYDLCVGGNVRMKGMYVQKNLRPMENTLASINISLNRNLVEALHVGTNKWDTARINYASAYK